MELTSLYPPPCISLTEILLAAGFAVSVLANVGLGWMLWKLWKLWKFLKPESTASAEGVQEQEFNDAWKVIRETHPKESDIIWRACQEQINIAYQGSKRYVEILINHGLAEEAGIPLDAVLGYIRVLQVT
jgi:hypothetical protein